MYSLKYHFLKEESLNDTWNILVYFFALTQYWWPFKSAVQWVSLGLVLTEMGSNF